MSDARVPHLAGPDAALLRALRDLAARCDPVPDASLRAAREAFAARRRAPSPAPGAGHRGMEPAGIEPATSCLQSRRSPS